MNTLTLKGFKYHSMLVSIEEPDFNITAGDIYVFDEKRYDKNMLIGVRFYINQYVAEAKEKHIAKYSEQTLITDEMIANKEQYMDVFQWIRKYGRKLG